MRKSLFLGVLLLFSLMTFQVFGFGLGDVNDDFSVDILDSMKVARHAVGVETIDGNLSDGDVNFDTDVNIVDALLIAKYSIDAFDAPMPGICTEGVSRFVEKLKLAYGENYFVFVEKSPLAIYPPLYIITVEQNYFLPLPPMAGLFGGMTFNISCNEKEEVIVDVDSIDARFNAGEKLDNTLLAMGACKFTGEDVPGAETLGMYDDILMTFFYSGNELSFAFGGEEWKLYRDYNGEIVLDGNAAAGLTYFVNELSKKVGGSCMVTVNPLMTLVAPALYEVTVSSMLDNPLSYSFSSMNFQFEDSEKGVLPPTINAHYYYIDPNPQGTMLYEGMELWFKKLNRVYLGEADIMAEMTAIYIESINKETGAIIFRDRLGSKWHLVRLETGAVQLTPIK